jgi:hypothetical protein
MYPQLIANAISCAVTCLAWIEVMWGMNKAELAMIRRHDLDHGGPIYMR